MPEWGKSFCDVRFLRTLRLLDAIASVAVQKTLKMQ